MHPVANSYRQSTAPLRRVLAQGLLLSCVLLSAPHDVHAADQEVAASLRGSIKALDSARQTALRDVESLPQESGDAADYRDFIVYLNTRIVAYCMQLAEQGDATALEGLPCPAGAAGTDLVTPPSAAGEEVFSTAETSRTETGPAGTGVVDTRTQAEKTADLEGDLLTALGDFDEMLLKEEGKVAARVPSQREASVSGQPSATGSNGASGVTGETAAGETGRAGGRETGTAGEDSAQGGVAGQGDRSGAVSGTQSSAGPGAGDMASSTYGVPGGTLPPPKDDDIVARQLREAAEKEPDPELKKKLWEEYWRYKGKKKSGE